jgi:uncharacterized protein (PEP-CTERM system associated)
MSPTNQTKNSCDYRALLLLATYSATALLLSLPSVSDAGDLVISPNMRTDLIFTDNVRLAPDGSPGKEADFVTRLIPGVFAKYTSRRFSGVVDYRLINIIYQNFTERNRTLHNLNAKTTGELLEDFFYVDGAVRMRQINRSLLGRQGDDVNLTGNLANIRQYSVSPYVRKRFGNTATTELRYARILSESDQSSSFFNSNANSYLGSLLSGPNFQVFQWGLNYARQDIDFDLRPDTVRIESGVANVRYNINRRFGITGTGGYENNTFGGAVQNKPKGVRWSAGFIWLPTPRTSIEASAGKRFFGDNYFLNASHRTRLFAFNTRYEENIRSAMNILNVGAGNTLSVLTALFTAQAPPGTDPADIAQVVQLLISELGLPFGQAFAASYLTNRFFLQKNFESSVALNAARNTILFRVFHRTRTPLDNRPLLDSVLGGGLAHLKQEGIGALLSHRVTERTRINANFLYRRLYFRSIGRRDEIKLFQASISRALTENIIGLLRYRRNDRSSNQIGAQYVENRFTATLGMRF